MVLWRRQAASVSDTLELLKNRLQGATYEEDRIETLHKLYAYAITHPADVTEVCLDSVVRSLPKTEERMHQGMILHALYTSASSSAMIQTLTSKGEYADIIFGCNAGFVAYVIRSLGSPVLLAFLSRTEHAGTTLRALLAEQYYMEFSLLAGSSIQLKETLVFEGALETLMKTYVLEKRRMPRDVDVAESAQCLISLLTGSAKNRQYFLDTDLFQQIITDFIPGDLEIIHLLLDPNSPKYPVYQKKLMQPRILTMAVERKAYDVIHSLINFNEANFKIFVERYLDIGTLVADCDAFVDAFRIVELLARYTHFTVASEQSLRVNTLLCILGRPFVNLSGIAINDFKNKKASMDHLIYLIFTKSTIEDILPHMNPLEYEEPLSSMWMLISLSFGTNHDYLPCQVLEKLRYLRLYLLSNEITLEAIRESLVSTIDQYLQQFNCGFEVRDYTQKKDEDIPPVKAPPEPKSAILEGVNSRIRGLFSRFTKEDDSGGHSENKSYDL